MYSEGKNMVTEQERKLITPCGLYCGRCPLYQARTDASLRKRIAEAQGIAEDKLVLCAGCRELEGKVPILDSPVCATYICVSNKRLEFCFECADFPCLKLAPCADRASEIPHNTKIYKLLRLQKDGAGSFIENYSLRTRQYLRGKKPNAGDDIRL
jgi:hypothetical protein